MFRLNLTKHCIKWYCFIQMQLMDTFVHYFVLVSLYLLQHCAFAAPVKYPDRDINRTRWKYIFSFYGLWTP